MYYIIAILTLNETTSVQADLNYHTGPNVLAGLDSPTNIHLRLGFKCPSGKERREKELYLSKINN